MIKNVAASVRDRLRNLSRDRGEEFHYVLTRYGLERLLYRLSRSEHAGRFLLKGGALFTVWSAVPHRATRDVDLLGFGDNDAAAIVSVFQTIVRTKVIDDGLEFDPETVTARPITEADEYQGLRVKMIAALASARISLQVDVGFGDAVTPGPTEIDYPTLLGHDAPRIRAYPMETVVAEKFEAMVDLGMANTRLKDFYDIWVLAQRFAFDGSVLATAIKATFARRNTPVPSTPPLALTAFATDTAKKTQWKAFARKNGIDQIEPLETVIPAISSFVMPVAQAVASDVAFEDRWTPGGPWTAANSSQSASGET